MILFNRNSWWGVIFTWSGTVWPQIRCTLGVLSFYAVVSYCYASHKRENYGSEGRTILFGTMSFLLIFRANQAYKRYWMGRSSVTEFFSDIRELIMLSLISIRGGLRTSTFLFHGGPGILPKTLMPEDAFDAKAREMRVDLVRLSIALAVAYKLHTRIALDGYCFGRISGRVKWYVDYDRFRLCQLLSVEEFGIVDGLIGIEDPNAPSPRNALNHLSCQFGGTGDEEVEEPPADWPSEFKVNNACISRAPIALVYLLRVILFRNMNGPTNTLPWGIKERFLSGLEGLLIAMQRSFEMAHQIITTPVPLPYANLCKTLLAIFMATLPFFVDFRLGWFANTVIPSLMSLALLGIDAIATELENPFGDDDNDLDILETINVLERESMEMMRLAGDQEGCNQFDWRALPTFVKTGSCRDVKMFLVMRGFAATNSNHDPDRRSSMASSSGFASGVSGSAALEIES